MVLPLRLLLRTPRVRATVPLLRGVWGAALHGLDHQVFRTVFQGEGPLHQRTPSYILRPAPPIPEEAPAVEMVVIGSQALSHIGLMIRAWDVASGMGLGPGRWRFHIRRILALDNFGRAEDYCGNESPWPLSLAAWPLAGYPPLTPCSLFFSAPLRLIRNRRLIESPALADLVVAAFRRLEPFLPPASLKELNYISDSALKLAREINCQAWKGGKLDLVRYSSSQHREVELWGVNGRLDLPDGPGDLWPLLAAMQWIHIGKGTTFGMGQLAVEDI